MDANSGSGSSGTFIWGLVAGIIVVVGAGGLYLSGIFGGVSDQPAPETTEVAEPAQPIEEQAEAGAEPEATTTDEAGTETADADTDEVAAPAVSAPVLDQIFVEPDGNAVLSGNAEPGTDVIVVLDGETVHSFTVDASGQFAEFVTIPFAETARGLVLQVEGEGEPVRSDDYLIAALPKPPAPEEPAPTDQEPPADVAEADTATTEPDAAPSATADTETAELTGSEPQAEDQPEATPEPQDGTETADAPDTEAQDQQIAIIRSGEEGVELIQPPTVQDTPPDQIALDTIGYSDTGEVELTGRTQDGSAVRLYLDNRLIADLPPAPDGQWRGELEGIDPGVYTLRVDEVAPDGTVVSRLETPFKREPVETLSAAQPAETGDTQDTTPPIRSVTVQRGDTLWAISRERFGDGILYVRLFEANRDSIRDPDLIYPGQIFTIPE